MKRYDPAEPCAKCANPYARVVYKEERTVYPSKYPWEAQLIYTQEWLEVICTRCGYAAKRAPLDAVRETQS